MIDIISSWILQLGPKFEELGLELKASDRIPLPERYRLPLQQTLLASVEDLTTGAAAFGTEQAEQNRQLMEGLLAETKRGVWLDASWMCAVGRKPLK